MIVFTILLILFQGMDAAIESLNETEYARMPPVIKIDPYEPCVQQPGGLYCDVQLTLVSDTPSELLTMIREYSAVSTTHYNHTRMHYSVCVTKTCSEFYMNTTVDIKWTLEACLNHTLWQTYHLKARVSDGYSCNVHEKHFDIDAGDIIVAGISLTILVANIIGSLSDFVSTTQKSKGIRLLQCFSIPRNWSKLIAPPGANPHMKQFQCIHGIRVFLTFCVVALHSSLPSFLFIENTRFMEEAYSQPFNKLFSNAPLVMQVFLMISALLLTYNVQLYAATHGISWTMVPKLILKRLWRLTPPYAIVLGFTATWLRYVAMGPRWQISVGYEIQSCRRSWWWNILYINNYFGDSQCMPHTWYLAVDTQLCCLGVLVYMICRSTAMKKVVLALLLIAGALGPALHTYFQDLDAIVIVSPEAIMTAFMDTPTFDNVYKRTHTNLAGYVVGLSMGYLIYHWQQNVFDAKKHKSYRFLCWAALALSVCVVYSGSVFYDTRPRDPVVLRAVYAGLSRTIFSVLIGVVLVGMIMQVQGVCRGVFAWRGWAAPSRLSYCTYLCHIAYTRYATATLTTTQHVSIIHLTENILMAAVASFAGGLVLWLLVEAPLASTTRLLTAPAPAPTNTQTQLEKGTVHDDKS